MYECAAQPPQRRDYDSHTPLLALSNSVNITGSTIVSGGASETSNHEEESQVTLAWHSKSPHPKPAEVYSLH